MLKVAVTGANGFVGQHAIRELKSRGHDVIAIGHGGKLATDVQDQVLSYHQCDLADPGQVAALPLKNINAVINLAGLAKQGASFGDGDTYKHMNVALLKVIGEELLKLQSQARVIAISTGAVYESDQPMPLTEKSRTITDGSPYAQSKLLMEQAAHDLRKKGLQCVIARPFNHAGPGQAPGFLIPDLFAKLTTAKDSGKPIKTGNLATKRDYTDVRDIAKAYADLVASETLEFDTYNVCSGTSHSGQAILDIMQKTLGLKIATEADPSLMRPTDPQDLYGSFSRIAEETGWEPTIPLEQTIADFVASQQSS